jgi:hypothetical protein
VIPLKVSAGGAVLTFFTTPTGSIGLLAFAARLRFLREQAAASGA